MNDRLQRLRRDLTEAVAPPTCPTGYRVRTFAVDDAPTVHCLLEVGYAQGGVGHQEPPSFVVGTAGLASIADAVEAWRPSTVRPRPLQRRVLPSNRPPRRAAVISAAG